MKSSELSRRKRSKRFRDVEKCTVTVSHNEREVCDYNVLFPVRHERDWIKIGSIKRDCWDNYANKRETGQGRWVIIII